MENGRSSGQQRLFQRTKTGFMDVCEYEIQTLKSVKIQFGLLAGFSMNRNEEVQHMQHYFNRMQPAILNEHNVDTLNNLLNLDRGLVSKRIRLGD